MTELLRKATIVIRSEGELVGIKIGNLPEMKMGYEEALLLSQWIRVRAKEAKKNAGDLSRHWSAIGTAHDARYGPGHTQG